MKRRDFIKTTAGVALSAAPLLNLVCGPKPGQLDKIGLQLYSVRDLMRKDFTGTITKVAEAGFAYVEFAGYYDNPPQDIRALLDKLGLTSPANHTSYNLLTEENLPQTIEAAKIIGHEYLVLPSLPRERRAPGQPRGQRPPKPVITADRVKELIDIFNRIGESCKEAGLRFAFHNHRAEFKQTEDGGILYDMLVEGTDPELVDFEMDLGWAIAAGADPLVYFEKFPGRFPLFHIKDFNDEKKPIAIGQGTIDYAPIFAGAGQSGAIYYIVEFEGREDTLDHSIACLNYLKTLTF